MYNIRFVFNDINDHLGRFIINLLQITVSMLLIAFAVISISNAHNFQNRMSRLENKKNIYIMDNITEMNNPEHFDNIYDPEYRDKYLPNAETFYQYLTGNDKFNVYIAYSSYLYDGAGGFDALFVNDNFIKYFCLKDKNGNALDNIFLMITEIAFLLY